MTLIAKRYQDDDCVLDYTPAVAQTAGNVIQVPDGRAGIPCNDIAADVQGAVALDGLFIVAKTAAVVLLDGQDVYFDRSAQSATYWPANDRDFLIGTAVGDSSATSTTVTVNLNVRGRYAADVLDSGFDTTVVKTAGDAYLRRQGGTSQLAFSATAEAQKIDLLSKRSFPATSNWIAEAVFEVVTTADADVADLSIGVANATHASDADSITESVFVHCDLGADLNIDAESDDGTTEVVATDTTIDFAVGTPVHIVIDGRDETDVKIYINGVQVLSGTTFTLADAAGPLKLLAHLEKTANDTAGIVDVDLFRVRIAE